EKDELAGEAMRLLKVDVEGDRAEALAIYPSDFSELLIKIRFVRVGDAWMLADMIQTDTGLHIISDNMRPAIRNILEGRSGKQTEKEYLTASAKILIAMNEDATVALELADLALKDDPKNRDLRYLRSLALSQAERDDEAAALWAELSDEEPPLAIAVLKLAEHYSAKEEEAEWKKAIESYERYLKLEPDDPRAHDALATMYRRAGDAARAEAQYREAIRCDARHSERYTDFAEFLANEKRYADALAVIDEGAKYGGSKDELLNGLLLDFYLSDESETAEGLIAAQPERLERNADANYYLAHIRIHNGRPREALLLLRKAIELDPDSVETHNALAEAYRALKDWRNALAAADAAIKIDTEDAESHYYRACALARLGRKTAAIAALKRAIEIDDEWAFELEEEEDLKPLAALAEFKKLLPKEEKDKR
ncbi:MAG: tetratricopeptide repeat protein, partial [Blastocatellia bacterium]|nr:tetratricopeptide repeat protein [Blastocatellia bacterium]